MPNPLRAHPNRSPDGIRDRADPEPPRPLGRHQDALQVGQQNRADPADHGAAILARAEALAADAVVLLEAIAHLDGRLLRADHRRVIDAANTIVLAGCALTNCAGFGTIDTTPREPGKHARVLPDFAALYAGIAEREPRGHHGQARIQWYRDRLAEAGVHANHITDAAIRSALARHLPKPPARRAP